MDTRIPVAVSARHVHLTRATLDTLFGKDHELQIKHMLSQPGQFAAVETVSLLGPRGRIDHVRVLGPPRDADQIELSRSDEMTLGLDAPLRVSGDLLQTPGIQMIGPAGYVRIDHGVVTAVRHIHMSPADASHFGVRNGQRVRVAVYSNGRDLVFGDVVVRVSPKYRLELHLDTDEGNAAGVSQDATAKLLTSDN